MTDTTGVEVPTRSPAETPRVAVIVPCYNDGATLPETLASLEDVSEPIEVAVVDDASTDPKTKALLQELERDGSGPRVVRRTQNGDVSAARMSGVAATSARFVFPLDADDLAVPAVLIAMADKLDNAPSASACVGDYEEFGDHQVLRAIPGRLDPFEIAYVNPFAVTALFRREALEEVGGWRTGIGYEDWDMWMALAERGRSIVHVGAGLPTFRRRTHGARMLADRKSEHVKHYREMRTMHPQLFERLSEYRKGTSLSRTRRTLYPLMYGGRKRFKFEPRLRRLLDRHGLWQLGE